MNKFRIVLKTLFLASAFVISAFAQEQPDSVSTELAKKECTNKLNINESVSKIQSSFLPQLKDCSVTLAKDMALAMSPFGKKGAAPEPVLFMKECTIDGIKKKLPDGAEEYLKPIEKFLQNVMNAASAAGGGLDVKKLSSAIAGLNVNELINELKTKAANDECVVNEPYEREEKYDDGKGDSGGEESRKVLSPGFRAGLNLSHLYADYKGASGSYNSVLGFQLGWVLDIAASDLFHIQPGVMYMQKGMEESRSHSTLTLHYIEIPVLLSLKLSVLRINAGPYLDICLSTDLDTSIEEPSIFGSEDFKSNDVGLSVGVGFDIGMFYIDMFYDYGFVSLSNRKDYEFYNRTLGFNLGVNL